MKTLEEYKKDFLNIGKMFLDVLQTDELIEDYSITRFATATAAIISEMGCFPQEVAFEDLFYEIERTCKKNPLLVKDNHGVVLSILMYCLLLAQCFREMREEYYEQQQMKKEFSTEQGRKILEYIEGHPDCLQREAAEYAGMSESNMSHFMAKNRKYQLWDVDKVGRSNYLRITAGGKRFIKYLDEEISNDDFPHNVNEENIHLRKQMVVIQEENKSLKEAYAALLLVILNKMINMEQESYETNPNIGSDDISSSPGFVFVSDETFESSVFEQKDKHIPPDKGLFQLFTINKERKLYEPSYA